MTHPAQLRNSWGIVSGAEHRVVCIPEGLASLPQDRAAAAKEMHVAVLLSRHVLAVKEHVQGRSSIH